jgi:hypothetical protein
MPLLGTDLLPIDRAGTLYKITGSDIVALVQSSVGTAEYTVANIAARNALTGLSLGDQVYVTDATGDATVNSGWAIYRWNGASFTKVLEQEGIDAVQSVTNLAYVAGPAGGSITNSNGTGFTIPVANGTNAGLMPPADKTKVDRLTVTAATDLDAMRTASHAAATLAGSASTNPLTLSGQVLGFSIAQLATAP